MSFILMDSIFNVKSLMIKSWINHSIEFSVQPNFPEGFTAIAKVSASMFAT